jgi:hypothetical protein
MPALSPSCHALLANSIYGIAGFADSVQFIYCQLTAFQYEVKGISIPYCISVKVMIYPITILNGVH